MATNNFKPFATGAGANVTSQADYEALSALLTGFQSGKASSAQINKSLRQSSTMAYVLAQFISDSASVDVLDNGTPATILANFKSAMTALTPGRMLNVQVFTSSGTYSPTAGAKKLVVEVLGGGGGGGSNANTSGNSSSASAAGGGGGGSYAKALLSAQNYTVIVGTGGTGGATTTGSSGNAGGAGGDSSIGSIIAYGGLGGSAGISIASLPSAGNTSGYAAMPAGNLIVGYRGEIGIRPIMYSSTAAVSGGGGRSMYSSGADGRYAQPVAGGYSVAGYDAFGYGGGGSGSASLGGSGGVSAKGGNGMSGIVIIWEYA